MNLEKVDFLLGKKIATFFYLEFCGIFFPIKNRIFLHGIKDDFVKNSFFSKISKTIVKARLEKFFLTFILPKVELFLSLFLVLPKNTDKNQNV